MAITTTKTPDSKEKLSLKYPRRAEFTIADIIELNSGYTAQTVRSLVHDAMGTVLKVVGKRLGAGRGRPSLLLSFV